MRSGVRVLVDVARDLWRRGEAGVVLFYAPGGYGESISPPYLLDAAKEEGLAEQLIHVLPTRALVINLYLCKYLYPFASGVEREKLEELCMGRVAYDELADVLRRVARGREHVGYQAGLEIRYGVKQGMELQVTKSPLFEDMDIVATTIDSLTYNAFKIPVTEVYSWRKHYAIPFSWIYTSLVYLDEMHASLSREAFSSIAVLLDLFYEAKVPVVAATATPIPEAEKLISESTEGRVRPLVVKMCRRGERGGDNVVCFYDDEFESKVLNVKWRTRFIQLNDVLNIVRDEVLNGRRILVATGHVDSAISIYENLKSELELSPLATLLHGRKARIHQRRVLEQVKDKRVLVATPVINAGVDITFDTAIVGVPDPLTLIQFLARVCRDNDCGEAEVYLIKELTGKDLYDKLMHVEDEGFKVNWHLPYSINGVEGYEVLLSAVSPPKFEQERPVKEKIIKLRDLAFSALLTASEIKDKFIELEGEIIRSILTEIIVLTEDEIERFLNTARPVSEKVGELEDWSLTTSFSDLVEALGKGGGECIGKFIVVDREGGLLKFHVENGDIQYGSGLIRRSYDYISMLVEVKARYAGFTLSKREGCYDEERGLLRLP